MTGTKKIIALVTAAATVLSTSLSAFTVVYADTDYVVEEVELEQYQRPGDNKLKGKDRSFGRDGFIIDTKEDESVKNIKASVPEIEIKDDMSNITNLSDYQYLSKDLYKKLRENGFVVADFAGKEFFEVYEDNRYFQTPNFVTVDSMMHTYHLYFAHLLRSIEKKYLYADLKKLTSQMQKESYEQYKDLKGTKWEEAAKRNVTFFSLGAVLLDETALMPRDVSKDVKEQYDLIMSASGIKPSKLTGNEEDYSQYKPRGYYEGDKTLEKYFRAMMLYGRMHFDQSDEGMDQSALLMSLAINDTNPETWESIYTVTSFFAGASDDLGYNEYMPLIEDVYGKDPKVSDIASDDKAWKEFHKRSTELRAPMINSIPIADSDEELDIPSGFRFMGQRFTIDATIMQNLVYRSVGEFSDEDKRLRPDFLDVPAALGSEMAYSLLDKMGATKYKHYDENLDKMKKMFAGDDNPLWNASLYAGWLNTLRPLLEEKGKGYPQFMQNDEWTKKDLETFAGSYTELKHDTILYSKQVMAEMGGDWDEEKDFRGYVEPEPVVYSRFEALAENTKDGLDKLGYLPKADKENLTRLSELAGNLKTISVKELENKKLSDDEYELIEIFGGEIEHFWLDVMKEQTGEEYPSADNYPAAIVVDVATDPNGTVLEMATGLPSEIYVVVIVDGKPRIATGAVYSFYQFEQPISNRLTDSDWRKMMGFSYESYEDAAPTESNVDKPEWTKSYRTERYEQ